jgi:sugar phosphate isomerase/epimerase
MFLPELDLPFEQALDTARELGAEYVWFDRIPDAPELAEMTDEAVDRFAAQVASRGLKLFLISAGTPFKQVHLSDLPLDTLDEHPTFQQDLHALVRSMAIAARTGAGAVCTYGFAWPGEYTAGKPTWPMRWLTRGGVPSELDWQKLVRAFSMFLAEAERHGVDLVVHHLPWHYTSTTTNFRALAERLAGYPGATRLKVMWGPADNLNSGEADVATAGYLNVRPYLHGLHLKDLRVLDGLRRKFEYLPLGSGQVDYRTILRQLLADNSQAVLAVATHFRPPSGSRTEAMQINVAALRRLIRQVEEETPDA